MISINKKQKNNNKKVLTIISQINNVQSYIEINLLKSTKEVLTHVYKRYTIN